jgi:hypothetical protein
VRHNGSPINRRTTTNVRPYQQLNGGKDLTERRPPCWTHVHIFAISHATIGSRSMRRAEHLLWH